MSNKVLINSVVLLLFSIHLIQAGEYICISGSESSENDHFFLSINEKSREFGDHLPVALFRIPKDNGYLVRVLSARIKSNEFKFTVG